VFGSSQAPQGFAVGNPWEDARNVASVSIGWIHSTRQVCLQGYMEVGDDGVTHKNIWRYSWEEKWGPCKRSRVTGAIHLTDNIVLPRRR
uniref:Uncharacterized protein n=2 Tax=Triticum urartu TaxID=4572 RepID=A0A8R7QKK2_TRIUA